MSRRSGLPWAPTSLPPMRQQWCHALEAGIGRLREQPAVAELVPQAEQDLAGIAKSVLFWPEFGHYWSVTFGKSLLPVGFGAVLVVAGY